MKEDVLKFIEKHQQSNGDQKNISISEVGFNKLCDTFTNGLSSSRMSGVIIGAATVGLMSVGFKGYDMFRKSREKKYFAVLSNNVTKKEVLVFVKAKDSVEAEKKVDNIIKTELDNECTFLEMHEI